MSDILDQAAEVATSAERKGQLDLIAKAMEDAPGYSFLFLLASPSLADGHAIIQISNATYGQVWQLMNTVAMSLINGEQQELDDAP